MPVDWASNAILSAAILGLVNIIDSHLISRRMPSLRAFMLLVGIIHSALVPVLFGLFPLPENLDIQPVLAAIASGILRTSAVTIMLYSLRKWEVSRVIPVVYTYPIFVAIMAAPLLGESLNIIQWLAIIIVVAGAALASLRQGKSSPAAWISKPLLLLLSSSLLFALADIAGKYALGYISFWNLFSINASCLSTIFITASIRPRVIKELINLKQKSFTLPVLALDEILAPSGVILSFWAMERGPVSLVSTIVSSRPMFVVIYALILSRFAPTFLDRQSGRRMLVLRLAATVLIFSGIAIIYLTLEAINWH